MDTKLTIHSKEAEEAVLVAICRDPGNLPTVKGMVRPECFYLQPTREIYKAILALESKKGSFDFVSISEEIKKTGKLQAIGGSHAVAQITEQNYFLGAVEEHAGIVYEKFLLRELSGLGMKIHHQANEPFADAHHLVDSVQSQLGAIDFISKNSFRKIGDVVTGIISDQRRVIEEGIKPGIGCGLVNVDMWHKKQKQELGIIAARPGMGKTAYMLANAKHTAVELGKPVAIFSLEMSTDKLVGRIMASEARIGSQAINSKSLTHPQLMSLGGGVARLLEAPIYFDDTPGIDIIQLRSKIRRVIREFGVEEVYIDYLQLMNGERKGNREQEISYISRNLKMIAKEENIPITALSQLSRDLEKRNDKRPQLSDLRESGAIEQDADWVFFLFRPEYYGMNGIYQTPGSNGQMETETFNGREVHTQNLLVVDCAKYREGSLFTAALKCYLEFMQIENYEVGYVAQPSARPLEQNNDFL